MDYFCRKDSNASRFWGIFTYFWRKETDSTLEPLVGRGKEAGGIAWAADTGVLGRSIDDECRVPRIQSCTAKL